MTVYGLHALTGVLGSVRRVTALSGKVVEAREFRGQIYPSDCDDNTLMLLDFGSAQFAFVYGTPAGNVVHSFGSPSFFGTAGSIIGEQWNGRQLEYPGWEIAAKLGGNAILPHYNEQHPTEEFHVFEDILQLVRWVREGVPTVSTAEHARHVIEIIEGAFDAAETGQAVELTTRF
ncbi:MAG: hypothetical protein FJX77_04355 [Armatimonadetes bacterium]|nr:hypothetical protein [Armatimonadota bacterium]